MYSTGLSYSRLRPVCDDGDRYGSAYTPWHSTPIDPRKSSATARSDAAMASSTGSSNPTGAAPRRPQRTYTRAATTSVTQLLSDSCSSLLQRLTTRVRGPSAAAERSKPLSTASTTTSSYPTTTATSTLSSVVGSTRRRLEDKYSSALERFGNRKRLDATETSAEPPASTFGRGLCKSATTSNVTADKGYHYAANGPSREKTPYRGDNRVSQNYRRRLALDEEKYPEPSYAYLDHDSVYRVRHRSNHSELKPRRSSKPQRTGQSEAVDHRRIPAKLKLYPIDIPEPYPEVQSPGTTDSDETTPTPAMPDIATEREAKRKEIQSLIMKYSALDEAYNRLGSGIAASAAATPKPVNVSSMVSSMVIPKYHQKQTFVPPPAVSRFDYLFPVPN